MRHLSSKYREEKLVVLDRFGLEGVRTRRFQEVLKKLGISSALIVIDGPDEILEKSACATFPGFRSFGFRD